MAADAQHHNTWKPATLENGAFIVVPLFIEKGETLHMDVESEQYVGRVRAGHKRGAVFSEAQNSRDFKACGLNILFPARPLTANL